MNIPGKEMAALELLKIIAKVEGKSLSFTEGEDETSPGQQWLFKTYAKCMDVVSNHEKYMPKGGNDQKAGKPSAPSKAPRSSSKSS